MTELGYARELVTDLRGVGHGSSVSDNLLSMMTVVHSRVVDPFNPDAASVAVKHCGTLRISDNMDEDTGITSVSLGDIDATDSLTVQSCGSLVTLSLPSLRYITSGGGIVVRGCPKLQSITLGALLHNTGTIAVGGTGIQTCGALQTMSFPVLKKCFSLAVQASRALTSVQAPQLEHVQNVDFVSCVALTTINLDSLVSLSYFYIVGCTLLASASFPALRRGALYFNGTLPALTSISAPLMDSAMASITSVYEGLNLLSCAALSSISFPVLRKASVLSVTSCTSLATVAFPALQSVARPPGSLFEVPLGGSLTLTGLSAMTSLSLPVLATVGGAIAISGANVGLTTISLPLLATVGSTITVSTCTGLTTLNLPALVTVAGDIAANSGHTALTTVALGTVGVTRDIAGNVTLTGQALSEASVDAILAVLASLDGTNGTTAWGAGRTVNLSGGTSATPSVAGLASKATIVARGGTVTNN
jgi:hypothetical protein